MLSRGHGIGITVLIGNLWICPSSGVQRSFLAIVHNKTAGAAAGLSAVFYSLRASQRFPQQFFGARPRSNLFLPHHSSRMPLAAALRRAGISLDSDCDQLWGFFAARMRTEREKTSCLAIGHHLKEASL